MARSELNVVTMDHDGLKQSLVQFLQSTEFGDFNYEGSAINTIVDLLTRNSAYTGFLANMLANESFITSAQIKANVDSHAQKLSHLPKSATASRLSGSVTVTPESAPSDSYITMNKGSTFISSIGGKSYSFVALSEYFLSLIGNQYIGNDIELVQGQFLTLNTTYTGNSIEIPNERVDTSHLKVLINGAETVEYAEASTLTQLNSEATIYFLSLNSKNKYEISFGNNILGKEPDIGTIITIEYIVVEDEHANGASSLISASSIEGYSNIQFVVDQVAYGGSEPEDIETTRFLAPKTYQIQDRALNGVDYSFIVQRDFPFVRSIISWNGEDNEPKRYGQVLLSIIGEEGQLLTNSIKEDIVAHLKDYGVGSVTPFIVDSNKIDVDLNISIQYDPAVTSDTYDTVISKVRTLINDINKQQLNQFKKGLYAADLTCIALDIIGVNNAKIKTSISRSIERLKYLDPIYEVQYKNSIVPGSVSAVDFSINDSATNHKLYDKEDGKLYISHVLNSVEFEYEVGTVDYEQGILDFVANFTTTTDFIDIHVSPVDNDVNVEQNYYININSISFDRIRMT